MSVNGFFFRLPSLLCRNLHCLHVGECESKTQQASIPILPQICLLEPHHIHFFGSVINVSNRGSLRAGYRLTSDALVCGSRQHSHHFTLVVYLHSTQGKVTEIYEYSSNTYYPRKYVLKVKGLHTNLDTIFEHYTSDYIKFNINQVHKFNISK